MTHSVFQMSEYYLIYLHLILTEPQLIINRAVPGTVDFSLKIEPYNRAYCYVLPLLALISLQ